MTGRKAITMCHFNRPQYTRQVLDALRGCEGVGDYLILPHVEPGDDEVRALVESIDFAECSPTFNRSRLGVNLNTENALLDGFGVSDYVIHIEDDIVCSPDALTYYEWCGERYGSDPETFSVTGYNRRETPVPAAGHHLVGLRKWFHPWGWATWRDRWELFSGLLYRHTATWDCLLNDHFCRGAATTRCLEVFPELSRSQNVGIMSSRCDLPPEWYQENHFLKQWAGNHEVGPGSFREAAARSR